MDPIYDTYISSTYPNNRYGSASYVRVGRNEIAYIQFSMPYIPGFATITSANLNVSYSLDVSGGSVGVYAYQVMEEWTPGTQNWNHVNQYANMGLADHYMSMTVFRDTNGETLTNPPRGTIDITDAVTLWYEGASDNYGIALQRYGGMSSYVDLSTMEGDIYRRPYVTINYDISENDSKTHYIQNVATGKYIDIEGPSKLEGAIIQQWQFNAKPQSRWYLSFESDGYFTLKSEYSNMYIGVDSTNSSVVKQYSTISDYTKWKAIKTASGNCKLVCKGIESSGMVLATPYETSGNGANLTMTTYTDDSNYKDEWDLQSCLYSFSIVHYYDQGYNVRFTNTPENIDSYQDLCSIVLLKLFGVAIDTTINSYTSCADLCTGTPTTLSHTSIDCNHTDDHKTRTAIHDDGVAQFNAGTDVITKVMWSGHSLGGKVSASYKFSHMIIMTIKTVTDNSYVNLDNTVIRAKSVYTLLHEVSHQLGAPDHYCYDPTSDNCNNPSNDCWRCDRNLLSPPDCIMTEPKTDIEERCNNGTEYTLYCSQCMSSTHSKGILQHLRDHHNQ